MASSIYAGQNLTELLAVLHYASRLPGYPENFVPPGFTDANYVPPSRGDIVVNTAYATTAIVVVIVAARFLTRQYGRTQSWGLDDGLILIATIGMIGFAVTEILIVRRGAGKHSYDYGFQDLTYNFTFEYATLMLYFFNTTMIKLSVLAFIHRLSPTTTKTFRVLVWITAGVVIVGFITAVFIATFQCNPIAAAWDLRLRIFGNYSCLPIHKLLAAWSAVFAATDVWLMILPSRVVLGLKLPLRTRVGIILIFCTGLVATIASFFRIKATFIAYNTWDPSWYFVPVLVASQLEQTFGIIAASLPSLNFWTARFLPSIFSTATTKRGSASPAKLSGFGLKGKRSYLTSTGDEWSTFARSSAPAKPLSTFAQTEMSPTIREDYLESFSPREKQLHPTISSESIDLVIQSNVTEKTKRSR